MLNGTIILLTGFTIGWGVLLSFGRIHYLRALLGYLVLITATVFAVHEFWYWMALRLEIHHVVAMTFIGLSAASAGFVARRISRSKKLKRYPKFTEGLMFFWAYASGILFSSFVGYFVSTSVVFVSLIVPIGATVIAYICLLLINALGVLPPLSSK